MSSRPILLGLIIAISLLQATYLFHDVESIVPLLEVLHYPANQTMLLIHEVMPLRSQSSSVAVENITFVLQWTFLTGFMMVEGR